MRCVLSLIVLMSLGFAPTPFPKPDASNLDLKRMQGTWVWLFSVYDGARASIEGEAILKIKENRASLQLIYNGREVLSFFFTLDARSTPRAIDIRYSANEKLRSFGRYSVEGDILKLCIGKEKRPRPVDLSGDKGTLGVWVFKRQKS